MSVYSVVDTDHTGGARAAAQHLPDLGHRTVWHVAGSAASFAAQRREESWEATLRAAGLDVPPVVRGDWTPESGYRAGLHLAGEADCTAVFGANDEMALGVLRAMHERNRAVPDVSVVGFDDIPHSASFFPPLTTVRQDFAEVGRQCVQGVLRQIRTDEPEHGFTIVPNRLVVRRSAAPPPQAWSRGRRWSGQANTTTSPAPPAA
jgi:DNA-binding LacI/PurR family transcriptional regulator